MSLDTDKSGFISYTEFLAATISKEIFTKSEKLKEIFEILDKDNNGYVTSSEFGNIVGGTFIKIGSDAPQYKKAMDDIFPSGKLNF